jgi:hypothetical protein
MRALPLTIHNMKWMEFLLELSCIMQNTGYKNKQHPSPTLIPKMLLESS